MFTKEEFLHKALLVPVNKCFDKPGLSHYDAIRYSWIVSRFRVGEVEYVLGVKGGKIVGVFEPEEWLEAFRGREAPAEIQTLYLGKQVSKKLRGQGVRYVGAS